MGTGSLRRAEQLRALAPGVEIAGVRGNVDTRIRKLRSGQYDAIILAAAGLERLGLLDEADELLAPTQMVPAIGQGALGIEIRAGDRRVSEALAAIHDLPTACEVAAERSLLRALGGGCDVPLGGHATCDDGGITLRAAAALERGGPGQAAGDRAGWRCRLARHRGGAEAPRARGRAFRPGRLSPPVSGSPPEVLFEAGVHAGEDLGR